MLKFQINDPKHLLPKIDFKKIIKKIDGDGFFEVSIIDSRQIKILNKKYRKINKATDVLSFCMNDKLLGEIFIAYDYAVKEAKKHEWSIAYEIALLFIHGVLHLLGYDHYDEKTKKIMFALQDIILHETFK